MPTEKNIEARILELEMKVTFQEGLLEELNQVLIQQQAMIDKLQLQNKAISQKLIELQSTSINALPATEPPPPHY